MSLPYMILSFMRKYATHAIKAPIIGRPIAGNIKVNTVNMITNRLSITLPQLSY